MTSSTHLPASPDDSPLRPTPSSKPTLIRPSTPPSQLAQNMPIIQTQLATPIGPTPSSSFGTRRSGSTSPTAGRSVGGDGDARYMLGGKKSSPAEIDEALLAGSGFAADEERGSRRGSSVEREKEKMKETEKRTLWFGDLEPWMDDNYIRQTCLLMSWRIESIKLIRASTQSTLALPTGQAPLNAGYCFITFPTQKDALDALTTVTPTPTNAPVTMPNSINNFKANWATGGSTSIPGTTLHSSPAPGDKEYSVFIGDLTPQTSEEDLVRVFMSPPDGVEAFESTVGAKIMRDPVSGSSKLFGFVRFTSEEDQQRALAEMGGISCLGRPMRVSSASVKTRTASTTASAAASPMSIGLGLPSRGVSRSTTPDLIHPRAVSGLGIPFAGQQELPRPRSVTAPVAQLAVPNHATPIYALGNGLRMRTPSPGLPLLSSDFATSSLGTVPDLSSVLQMQQASASVMGQSLDPQLALTLLQIQALAALPIAPNPNGPPVHHQVSYNDPNNSTVFVGGLSSLINEETLQILFSPFGDIGYVRIPPNKSCGFVHYVHKSDANRAIERMQGFPLAGTKVRLSWGKPSTAEAKTRRPNAELSAQSSPTNIATIQAQQVLQAAQLNLAMQNLGSMNGLSLPVLQQLAAMNSTMPAAQNNMVNTANVQALINAQVAQANYGNNNFNHLGQMSAQQQLNGMGGQSAADQLMFEQLQQHQLRSMQALQNPYGNGQSAYGNAQSDPNSTPPFQPFSPIPLVGSNGPPPPSSYPSRLDSTVTPLLNPLGLGSDWNSSTSFLRPAEPDHSARRSPSPTFLANSELLRRRVSNHTQTFGVTLDNEELPGAGNYLQRVNTNGGGALRASHGDLRVNLPSNKDFRQRASSEAVGLEDTFRSMSFKQNDGNRSSFHAYNSGVNDAQRYGRE